MSKEVKQMEYQALERTFAGVRDLVLLSPAKIDSGVDYNFRKQLREKKVPKQKDKLKVKTAVADGQPVPMATALTMPTRLEAIGEIVAMILGPAASIAAALGGPGGQVASQIASIADR